MGLNRNTLESAMCVLARDDCRLPVGWLSVSVGGCSGCIINNESCPCNIKYPIVNQVCKIKNTSELTPHSEQLEGQQLKTVQAHSEKVETSP